MQRGFSLHLIRPVGVDDAHRHSLSNAGCIQSTVSALIEINRMHMKI